MRRADASTRRRALVTAERRARPAMSPTLVPCRSGPDEIAEAIEKGIRIVVVVSRRRDRRSRRSCARSNVVRVDDGARRVSRAVDAVGADARRRRRAPPSAPSARATASVNSWLRPPLPRPGHGHRGLARRQITHSGRGDGRRQPRDARRHAPRRRRAPRRSPARRRRARDSRALRPPARAPSMAPRCGPITARVRTRQARIAGARRLRHGSPAAPRSQPLDDRRRERARRRRGASSTASASANVLGRRTVGPEAITDRSSPTTSDTASVSIAAAARRGEQPALDRRQVLADGVQLVDVGARFEQRGARSAACPRASALGRQRHQRRAAARQQHEQQLVGAHARAPVASARRAPATLPVGRQRMPAGRATRCPAAAPASRPGRCRASPQRRHCRSWRNASSITDAALPAAIDVDRRGAVAARATMSGRRARGARACRHPRRRARRARCDADRVAKLWKGTGQV